MNNVSIIYQSEEQQHSFNFPFQIGTHGDDPNKADNTSHIINNNDIIILGTDGLFDNLYGEDIRNIVEQYLKNNKDIDCNNLSKILCEEAFKKGDLKDYLSPFAKRAREAGYNYNGGKSDDITVVVGILKINNKDDESIAANI